MSSARFLVDDSGQKLGVLLELAAYEAMLADLEEFEAIRAYDAAKASGDEAIPLTEAFAEIERQRAATT